MDDNDFNDLENNGVVNNVEVEVVTRKKSKLKKSRNSEKVEGSTPKKSKKEKIKKKSSLVEVNFTGNSNTNALLENEDIKIESMEVAEDKQNLGNDSEIFNEDENNGVDTSDDLETLVSDENVELEHSEPKVSVEDTSSEGTESNEDDLEIENDESDITEETIDEEISTEDNVSAEKSTNVEKFIEESSDLTDNAFVSELDGSEVLNEKTQNINDGVYDFEYANGILSSSAKVDKPEEKKKSKKKILILILIFLLLIGVIIYFVFFTNKTDDSPDEIQEIIASHLSYDINEDCLEYISSLDEVTYDTIATSDYADTLYLYNTIYDEDVVIEEQYLVCLTNIVYVTENETVETDLAEAIATDSTLIDVLNESLLVSNVFTDEQNMSVVMLTRTLDITAPELTLKAVSIKTTGSYDINSFIESCTDDTDTECSLSYENEDMANYSSAGTYDITIIATDSSGNATSASTTLTITKATTSSNNSSSNSNKNTSSTDTTNSSSEQTKTMTCSEKLALNSDPSKIDGFKEYTTETSTKTSYKFGVEVTTTTTLKYAVFSDIGKCLYTETSKDQLSDDRSGYNATNAQLKSEATSILSSNLSSIKEGVTTINGYRSEISVANLNYNYNLSLAATMRAIEMYWSGNFSHTRPDGSTPNTILDYLGVSYTAFAENIASGYSSLSGAIAGWKVSSGHYANMTNTKYANAGLGYYKSYYVALFTN